MRKILSLGAGVQSTTLALLSKDGVLEMPECAIFADTGSEPAAVYKHLEWLVSVLPFPVHIVRAWEGYGKDSIKQSLGDSIRAAARGEDGQGSHSRPPFFTLNEDGSSGFIQRQCTGDFKITPIQRKIRELLGLRRGQRWPLVPSIEQWIGISVDEASRMKPSGMPAVEHRWPLIELRMRRQDCLRWLAGGGYPTPPKSACTFCPFHDKDAWRALRDNDEAGWSEAVEMDRMIRHGMSRYGLDSALYLHSSRKPLDEVDLDSEGADPDQINLFENECEGMCGV